LDLPPVCLNALLVPLPSIWTKPEPLNANRAQLERSLAALAPSFALSVVQDMLNPIQRRLRAILVVLDSIRTKLVRRLVCLAPWVSSQIRPAPMSAQIAMLESTKTPWALAVAFHARRVRLCPSPANLNVCPVLLDRTTTTLSSWYAHYAKLVLIRILLVRSSVSTHQQVTLPVLKAFSTKCNVWPALTPTLQTSRLAQLALLVLPSPFQVRSLALRAIQAFTPLRTAVCCAVLVILELTRALLNPQVARRARLASSSPTLPKRAVLLA